MPQMIFVYSLIVSHFDALTVRFNEYSRLQGFETKGGTWASCAVHGAKNRDLAAWAAGCGSWDRHTDKHGVPGGSLASLHPALKPCPPCLYLSRNTCRSAATLGNKSEQTKERANQEESEHRALSLHHRGPQVPAWAWFGCCLCSSLTSARGLELSSWTRECWGN